MNREDFPLISNSDIAYLDNAATSQKPKCVIDAVNDYYNNINANPHRGTYKLSEEATKKLTEARENVRRFINARMSNEIIFTKNATEAFNLIAYSYGLENVNEGDEIVLSIMEHHSNLVPWQMVSSAKNAKLKYLYVDDNYEIFESELSKITDKTKIVAITYVSNVTGVVNDVRKIVKLAHEKGAIVVLDATQAVAHVKIDQQKIDADFVVFSGHKMYAPMGVGVLYGKEKLLENMNPFIYGGDMIEYVYEENATFAALPERFEAGTQNVGAIVGLSKAIDYLEKIGFDNIEKYENELLEYTKQELKKLDFVETYYPSNDNHYGIISFNVKGVHAHDASSILNSYDVCVRSGNHCAQPFLRKLGLESTVRMSISFYNTKEDIDKMVVALKKVNDIFGKYVR